MTNNKANRPMRPAQRQGRQDSRRPRPEWADGLRQLYDSVLNEPLPGSFVDLLSKLDETSQ